jgi:hypothetical protein
VYVRRHLWPLLLSESYDKLWPDKNGNRNQRRYIDVVFDGPPAPEGPRFVEVENEDGRSIDFGEWIRRPDGYWALRFPFDGRRDG